MLLCDIGNTSYHFHDGKCDYKEPVSTYDPASLKDELFFVNVNPQLADTLSGLSNWNDLSLYIDWNSYYDTMGVDRIMVCEAVHEGVIIDAGSAITVDIVRDNRFDGGFIMPGVDAMMSTYSGISERLGYSFNFELELDKMPKNSRDAVSYGFLGLLGREVSRHALPVYLTGGNAEQLTKLFPGATVDQELVFKGMRKLIKKAF
jgi:type III pantothenate kinase